MCCIVPPDILLKLLEHPDKEIRDSALSTLLLTAALRGERSVRANFGAAFAAVPTDGRRTIFDCRNSTILSTAVLARTEQGSENADESVNRAFDGFGTTREFFKQVFDRNSIDGFGMRLDGYVHRLVAAIVLPSQVVNTNELSKSKAAELS